MDLHAALAETAVSHHIQTATFNLLGGLHEATFTAYDGEPIQREIHPSTGLKLWQ